jgi:hypothetical protein
MAAKKSTPTNDVPAPNETGPIIATVDEEDVPVTAVAVVQPIEIIVDEPAETPVTPQVVYVSVPPPPKAKGNRGIGSLLALAGAAVYAIVLAITLAIMTIAATGTMSFGFISNPSFLVPIGLFALSLIVVVLIVNRGGWWNYVIGSVLVGLAVYFGSVGMILLLGGVVGETPAAASALFRLGLVSPFTIAAALVAREVAMWTGALIGIRGKKVKARNRAAIETYGREQAERRAEATAS